MNGVAISQYYYTAYQCTECQLFQCATSLKQFDSYTNHMTFPDPPILVININNYSTSSLMKCSLMIVKLSSCSALLHNLNSSMISDRMANLSAHVILGQ